MDTADNLIEKFRNKNFKITPQRMGIFKILEGNLEHPSAEDIFSKIKKIYPATIFYHRLQDAGYFRKDGRSLKDYYR
jgi:Fur family peroxide stress response transcriptional regulator